MKKAIYFLSLLSLIAVGCSKKEVKDETQKARFKARTFKINRHPH